jgi:hypothetical protein
VSVLKRWYDDANTEPFTAHESPEYDDHQADQSMRHALEITGAIDLSTAFDQAAPSTAAQDAVVRDACGAATSEYLSPVALGATGMTVRYQPIAAKGWDAGSRRIACRIGSAKPDGGWATLLGTAKTGVLIDGQSTATLPSPAEPHPR